MMTSHGWQNTDQTFQKDIPYIFPMGKLRFIFEKYDRKSQV